jgi:hypothetical protein
MPFTKDDYILCLDTRTQDASKGLIKDETPYGAPNQLRVNQANFLVVAKLGENQTLSFVSGIDNSDPINALQWYFTTDEDSEYRFFLFETHEWANDVDYQKEIITDSIITQYGNIVYHVASAKFYKAIETSGPSSTFYEPSVTVGWQTYWVEISDFSTQILTDQLIVHLHDDLVAFKYEDCLKDVLVNLTDDVLCGVCQKWEDMYDYFRMELLLTGAESENWQNHPDRADFIITEATMKFCC